MTASDPETKALEEYRRSLHKKKQTLEEHRQMFQQLAQNETDEFKRLTEKMFVKCMDIMDDMFSNIEMWSIAQTGLKLQIVILKDILLELKEVQESPQLQGKINSLFRSYDSSI
jgi:hypothetical protein